MENHRKTIGKWWFYPLVITNIAMERSTIFNGEIHYFDWVIFNSYVKLPEGKYHCKVWHTFKMASLKPAPDEYWTLSIAHFLKKVVFQPLYLCLVGEVQF